MQGIHELREVGSKWEKEFAKIVGARGALYCLHQEDRDKSATFHFYEDGTLKSKPLPDVTVFTSPGFHAEVKHKSPTRTGWIGLERHRIAAMRMLADASGQHVLYVVHRSDTDEWIACSIKRFERLAEREMMSPSLVCGVMQSVPTVYTPVSAFTSLDRVLADLLPMAVAA